MVFDFESADAGGAAQALAIDEGAEFRHGHGFLHAFDVEKVFRLHDNRGIELISALDLLARAAKGALHVAVEGPRIFVVRKRVVLDGLCGETRHEFLLRKLVERETRAGFRAIVEVGDVSHHATVDLHLDVVGFVDRELLFDVLVFEIHARYVALGDDVGTQSKGGGGNNGRPHEERPEQTSETHARAFHGDDF